MYASLIIIFYENCYLEFQAAYLINSKFRDKLQFVSDSWPIFHVGGQGQRYIKHIFAQVNSCMNDWSQT